MAMGHGTQRVVIRKGYKDVGRRGKGIAWRGGENSWDERSIPIRETKDSSFFWKHARPWSLK